MWKWHRWTEEERAIIRRDYTHTKESCQQLAAKLSLMSGDRVTPCAVKGQVSSMGIAKRDDRRPWTPEEKVRLIELIPKYSPRRIARMMHRSLNSVTIMSKRLHLCRRERDGWFTKNEVCAILGADHKWVQRRIELGCLKASYHYGHRPSQLGGSAWHIDEADLKDYIRRHPEELMGRNCDMIMIVEILAGIINGQGKGL